MACLLVVEDDDTIRRMVVKALDRAGHTVIEASDGSRALAEFGRSAPDLIVLDLLLPGIDGRDVCRTIRLTSRVPILMLTALAKEDEVVRGLDTGADDYLTKPFSIRELQARVNALLRRGVAGVDLGDAPALSSGLFAVDPARHVATVRGEPVELTPTEFRLLYCLVRNAGRVVPARVLIREAQDYNCEDREAQEIVKVHIRHLRHKVEPEPQAPRYIVNARGVGYMLRPRPGAPSPDGEEM